MKKRTIIIVISFIIVAVIACFFMYQNMTISRDTLTYNEFINNVESKKVKEVRIKDENILEVRLYGELDIIYNVPNPQTDDLREYLLINDIIISDKTSNTNILFGILGIGMLFFIIFRNGLKGFGKDKMPIVDANKNKLHKVDSVTFQNIAGNEEAKELVKDIIDFIKTPDKYIRMGARMPKGILLYGPPGTGKTMMAKAVAGEAGVPFFAVSGSDFVQMYVGVGASRIRQLFKKAKANKKAVIFIDEIDAIGKKRSGNSAASNDERDQTLNALLTEMSGFNSEQGIIVIAATNRLDTLDEALLRPGRFDRQIEIGLPDVNARNKILNLHAQNKPIHEDVDLYRYAKETVYFSGAMLESFINEAAIIAANEVSTEIDTKHLNKAFYTVIAGAEKKDRSHISNNDRKITAYHEAGHALVTKLLLPENMISKVTIIPSTKGFGGFSMNIPKDKLYRTKQDIIGNIKVMLAGRIAEEIIFGLENITTGAANDIEKSSSMIKDYVVKFGMDDEFGLFNHEAANLHSDNQIINKCRDKMKKMYEETKNLMNKNLELLHTLAEKLLQNETLNEDDIDRIFKVA